MRYYLKIQCVFWKGRQSWLKFDITVHVTGILKKKRVLIGVTIWHFLQSCIDPKYWRSWNPHWFGLFTELCSSLMRGVCGGFDGYPHIWLLMEDFTGIDGMCGNQESGQSCCAAATLSISRGLMVEGKVSQAQPDQQLGQHLTLHWSAINLMKHLGLAHFFLLHIIRFIFPSVSGIALGLYCCFLWSG